MSRTTEFRWHTNWGGGARGGRDVREPDLVDEIHKFWDEDRRVSLITVAAWFGVGKAKSCPWRSGHAFRAFVRSLFSGCSLISYEQKERPAEDCKEIVQIIASNIIQGCFVLHIAFTLPRKAQNPSLNNEHVVCDRNRTPNKKLFVSR